MKLERIEPDWRGGLAVVAAPGPSLTPEVAAAVRRFRTVAVQDAYRLLPWADILYGCDAAWWRVHKGCPGFVGEKWSTHDTGNNDKWSVGAEYGLRLAAGEPREGFSTDPGVIHYGGNSGFQAVNLALLKGARQIVLVGFDMRGKHFFGDHPKPLRNPYAYATFIRAFNEAARRLPNGVTIVNATPGSAMTCFPIMSVDEALGVRVAA